MIDSSIAITISNSENDTYYEVVIGEEYSISGTTIGENKVQLFFYSREEMRTVAKAMLKATEL